MNLQQVWNEQRIIINLKAESNWPKCIRIMIYALQNLTMLVMKGMGQLQFMAILGVAITKIVDKDRKMNHMRRGILPKLLGVEHQ